MARSGAIASLKPWCPACVDVDPFDPVRDIDVADCWESVRGRLAEILALSYLLLDQDWENQRGPYRGEMPGHGASSGRCHTGSIASTMLLPVDGRTVALRVVCGRKKGGNLGLDLCLLEK